MSIDHLNNYTNLETEAKKSYNEKYAVHQEFKFNDELKLPL